jgi:hypothetical protein
LNAVILKGKQTQLEIDQHLRDTAVNKGDGDLAKGKGEGAPATAPAKGDEEEPQEGD